MCKELPVIPVNKVVDPKSIIGKKEGQGGGEAQGVADQKKVNCQVTWFQWQSTTDASVLCM
jgi:hypothetical protein